MKKAAKKHIHFVGIKGVGNTALAIVAKEAGCVVTGSDVGDVFITDRILKENSIQVFSGFQAEHIGDAAFVITTGAHGGFDNVEVKTAKQRGIPVISQGEAVGLFMRGSIFGREGQKGIAVAGTHGKTTTSAMIATLLKECNLDPSYVIGTSFVPTLSGPGHFGKGKYFVAEADEYATEPTYDPRPKFLWINPKIIVLTNIEYDHPDIFPSLEYLRQVFLEFVRKLPSDGVLVACGDDEQVKLLLKEYNGHAITYGLSPANDYVLKRVSVSKMQTFFNVSSKGMDLGGFRINVSGEHNALNSLAALIIGIEISLPLGTIADALTKYKGAKRRMEFHKKLSGGALAFDDYAHHPTEIKKTLSAFRQMYPHKKIVCIFQPHTYSRTEKLFEQFSRSFKDADTVIIIDIYSSLREQKKANISAQLLSQSIQKNHRDVVYLPTIADVVKYIAPKVYSDSFVVLTMGAGDVYKLWDNIV